ncbi:MAG TPA: KTSC domain-containing protein [Actinomycetota bacterium]
MGVPELVPVDSSSIEAIGYDAARRELHVRFLNGGVYVYSAVSPETHRALMDAESKGRYLNLEIKPGHAYRLAR